jgi:dTDP-glucose pyrophosphorylase
LNINANQIKNTRTQTLKSIILAGNSGTRLSLATLALSKQRLPMPEADDLLPVSTLMQEGIRDVLIPPHRTCGASNSY